MRAEDRHKMQQNELAEWLARWAERLKPYWNVLLLGVLLVVLAAVAAVWWAQQSSEQSSMAWSEVYRALSTRDSEQLRQVAAENPGSNVAHWAAVLAGDISLSNGCQRLFDNKAQAIDDLQQAIGHYRVVREESREPALLERAWFGTARAYEALAGTRRSQGELERAREAYQEVVERWPDGPYGKLAARRLEELEERETKAFYDKFAQFEPQPPQPSAPTSPGDAPALDLDSLPEDGSLPGLPSLPELPGPGLPGEPGGAAGAGDVTELISPHAGDLLPGPKSEPGPEPEAEKPAPKRKAQPKSPAPQGAADQGSDAGATQPGGGADAESAPDEQSSD